MTDDIVTRLRKILEAPCEFPNSVLEDAVEEIELLRKELKKPTVVPQNHVLVLSQPSGQQPFMSSELAEIANGIKEHTGIEVILLSGWDVVGFIEKDNNGEAARGNRK